MCIRDRMCFGLRTDFQTRLFPGSRRLMEVADTIQEIKTICDCGAKEMRIRDRTCTVLANDYDNPVEIVASLGASIAIACSDVPWNGPVATTNVAHLNGKYIINPSSDERDAADCFVCISSTFEKRCV